MHWIITAGPTREALDPVRYLSNHSSGKMGYAIAAAAVKHGHKVTLVSGPTNLDVPAGVDYIHVESAADMWEAVKHVIGEYRPEVAVMCAAVADYTPVEVAEQKIKKTEGELVLRLKRTRDILGSLRSDLGYAGYIMGFAAETENVLANARGKLEKKSCDVVVANDVSASGLGFGSSRNRVTLVHAGGDFPLEEADKEDLGHELVHWVERAMKERRESAQ